MTTNGWKKILWAGLLLAAMLPLLPGCSAKSAPPSPDSQQQQSTAKPEAKPAPSFPERPINFVVPVPAGGGYDRVARVFAQYAEKYLPSKQPIVVENLPGMNWNQGVSKIYKANDGGYTIGILHPTAQTIAQITTQVDYDITKVQWIGTIYGGVPIAFASAKSPYRTVDDLRKAPVVRTAVSGVGFDDVVIEADVMGIKVKTVSHEGSAPAVLSLMRGDTDFASFQYSMVKEGYTSGDLVPLWIRSDRRAKELPDVPTIAELGHPEVAGMGVSWRSIGVSPDVPKEVVQIWRDVFNKTMQDPEFQSAMTKIGEGVDPLDEVATGKIVDNAMVIYDKYKSLLSGS